MPFLDCTRIRSTRVCRVMEEFGPRGHLQIRLQGCEYTRSNFLLRFRQCTEVRAAHIIIFCRGPLGNQWSIHALDIKPGESKAPYLVKPCAIKYDLPVIMTPIFNDVRPEVDVVFDAGTLAQPVAGGHVGHVDRDLWQFINRRYHNMKVRALRTQSAHGMVSKRCR